MGGALRGGRGAGLRLLYHFPVRAQLSDRYLPAVFGERGGGDDVFEESVRRGVAAVYLSDVS